jgi:hypothetical protein
MHLDYRVERCRGALTRSERIAYFARETRQLEGSIVRTPQGAFSSLEHIHLPQHSGQLRIHCA